MSAQGGHEHKGVMIGNHCALVNLMRISGKTKGWIAKGRVAQEPSRNRNRRNRFSRNQKRNRNLPFLLNCTETQKTLFAEDPPEPKTGTA